MAIRDKMKDKATPHLRPGETIQAAFGAQTTNQGWVLLAGVVFLVKNNYRVVIATDQRILVTDSGKLSSTSSKSVVHELPRSTLIGPPTGLWYSTKALGEPLYIQKRFYKDVEVADSYVA